MPNMTLRLSDELHGKLKKRAGFLDRSVHWVVVDALEKATHASILDSPMPDAQNGTSGVEQSVARRAHNPEVVGAEPTAATEPSGAMMDPPFKRRETDPALAQASSVAERACTHPNTVSGWSRKCPDCGEAVR